MEALVAVLTRVRASDSVLFLDRHHRLMCNYLNLDPANTGRWKWFVEYQIAILKCLEQIGDKNDLPTIVKLAKREPKSDKEAQIVEAARECMISLGCRLGNDIAGETLLRPAIPDAAMSLVRPANDSNEVEQAQLLRAANQ